MTKNEEIRPWRTGAEATGSGSALPPPLPPPAFRLTPLPAAAEGEGEGEGDDEDDDDDEGPSETSLTSARCESSPQSNSHELCIVRTAMQGLPLLLVGAGPAPVPRNRSWRPVLLATTLWSVRSPK